MASGSSTRPTHWPTAAATPKGRSIPIPTSPMPDAPRPSTIRGSTTAAMATWPMIAATSSSSAAATR
ncbi:hypothetical protein G6F32_015986 [Rhizopus arrhizus]|nr:hypothetical protein G6F32_015986 [Rhizopus arrhizus]